MKKALLLVGVLAVALGITYLVLHKSNSGNNNSEEKDEPLAISSKTSAFNRSFAVVLNNYYELSDGFAASDSSRITGAAQKLLKSIDSIRFDQFKADTAIIQTAVSLAQSMQGEINGLQKEKTMEQKKREFNMITDELYSLIRTVRYDGSTVYHMRCPNAFADSSEAYWLSPVNKILNPYAGSKNAINNDKIQDQGEISDSLHFSAPVSE
ncbi:MAG TPA: DUF3347 domain-containing protein [Puia sp.]|jgi:hypothetical protein|nr:DUF3347 domain-containing protein [Puia sp.]